jgi:hypothetical protein
MEELCDGDCLIGDCPILDQLDHATSNSRRTRRRASERRA